MSNIKSEYKEMAAAAGRLFWEKKCTPGMDSGDVSMLDPETGYIYILPRPGKNFEIPNWGIIKAENICVVDLDGNLVEDVGLLPTIEMNMHLYIYKARPKIKTIIHSHPIWSSAFAVTGKNIPLALAEQSLFLGGDIVCAEYGPAGSIKLAENIVKALGKNKMAALLRNHGAVILGSNFTEAFTLSDFLEHCAQTIIMGSILSKVIEVDPEDILDDSLK